MSPENQLADLVGLDSAEYRLSDWEVDFVDSCERRTRSGQALTDKQRSKISHLWDQCFIHGKRSAV